MSLRDYSFSYTIQAPVFYFDAASGNYGSPSTIDVSSLLLKNDYGSPTVIEVSELLVNDDYGSPSYVTVSGLSQPLIFFGDIVHYSEDALIWADAVSIEGLGVVKPAITGISIQAKARRFTVSEQTTSGVLSVAFTPGVVTNRGSTGPVNLNLPSNAPVGTTYTIVKTTNEDLTISTESIFDSILTGAGTSGEYSSISLDSVGSVLSVTKEAENAWIQTYERDSTITNLWELQPDQIDGLAAWYDGSDSSTITIEPTNNVSQWDDKTIFGRDLTSGADGDRPSVSSGTLNGLDGIVFERLNLEYLKINEAILSEGPWTVIMITEQVGTGSNQYLLTFGSDTSNTDYKTLQPDGNTPRLVYQQGGSVDTVNPSSSSTVGVAYKAEWIDTNNGLRSFTSNGATAEGTLQITPVGYNVTGFGRLERLSPFGGADSIMYEAVMFSGLLTARETEGLNKYFLNKWGI
jgi:hypothetical protein